MVKKSVIIIVSYLLAIASGNLLLTILGVDATLEIFWAMILATFVGRVIKIFEPVLFNELEH